jgi:hypothetical protein
MCTYCCRTVYTLNCTYGQLFEPHCAADYHSGKNDGNAVAHSILINKLNELRRFRRDLCTHFAHPKCLACSIQFTKLVTLDEAHVLCLAQQL